LDDISVGYIGFWVLDIWIFKFFDFGIWNLDFGFWIFMLLILDIWNLEFALNNWNVFG